MCKNKILKIKDVSAEKGKKYLFEVKTERRINDLFTKDEKVNNLLLKNSIACDKIIGQSVLRTRQPGDSIRLAGRGCTKTLKKLYNELAVPENMREHLPVMADDKGVISERSKILPRRTTGTCAMHQRQLTEAIKRARQIALLPFVTE